MGFRLGQAAPGAAAVAGRHCALRKTAGQIAPEAVVIAGVMLFLLLAMYTVSVNLQQQWDRQRQSLQAEAAASDLAQAINTVAAEGDGTSLLYFNSAGPEVTNVSVYQFRSLRAYYKAGGFVSVALVTNQTNSSFIPLNADVWLNNTNGTVCVSGA